MDDCLLILKLFGHREGTPALSDNEVHARMAQVAAVVYDENRGENTVTSESTHWEEAVTLRPDNKEGRQ